MTIKLSFHTGKRDFIAHNFHAGKIINVDIYRLQCAYSHTHVIAFFTVLIYMGSQRLGGSGKEV